MPTAVDSVLIIDLEQLTAKIAVLQDNAHRQQVSQIVTQGYTCLTRLQSMDLVSLEKQIDLIPRDLWSSISDQATEAWSAVEELQSYLVPLVREHEAAQAADGSASNDLDLGDGLQSLSAPPRAPKTTWQRLCENAWAMTYVFSGELQGFTRRLPNLLRLKDGWELVNGVQEHVGHLRSGINALLTGTFACFQTAGTSQERTTEQSMELLAARELRARLFELRDQILTIEGDFKALPPNEWSTKMQAALRAINRFMFGPAFGWMRAADKRSFIQQRQILSDLLEMWTPMRALPARRAVEALARYLEALEVINQRECLIRHDKLALQQVVTQLELSQRLSVQEARVAIAGALAALADAQGRDRELDALLAQTLNPAQELPTVQILGRAQSILSQLGG